MLEKADQMLLATDPTGRTGVWYLLPSEVELDALVARARPLFLERDRCSFKKGLAALRRLVRDSGHSDAADYCEALQDLRAGWVAATQASNKYFYAEQPVEGSATATVWSSDELHEAHLYGDVVHADAGRELVGSRTERVLAAWSHHADIVGLAHTSATFVEVFNEELGLGIPSWAFNADDLTSGLVRARGEMLGVWMAPVGEDVPDDKRPWLESAGLLQMDGRPPGPNFVSVSPPPGRGVWLKAHPSQYRHPDG